MKTLEITYGDLNTHKQKELRESMPDTIFEDNTYLFSLQVYERDDISLAIENSMIEKIYETTH